MTAISPKLRAEFADKNYRHAYLDEFINSSLATQIRTLRIQRGLQQGELAQLAGMAQSRISALENVNYSSWSLSTLKRLARAFDVALVVRLAPFSEVITQSLTFDQAALRVPSFDDDLPRGTEREQVPRLTPNVVLHNLFSANLDKEPALNYADIAFTKTISISTHSSYMFGGWARFTQVEPIAPTVRTETFDAIIEKDENSSEATAR